MMLAVNQCLRLAYCCVLLATLAIPNVSAQGVLLDTLALEQQLKHLYGGDKLRALNLMSTFYKEKNNRKYIRYSRQASELASKLFDGQSTNESNPAIVEAHLHLAHLDFEREKYLDFAKSVELLQHVQPLLNDGAFASELTNLQKKLDSLDALGKIRSGFINRTLSNLNIGEAVREKSQNIKIKSQLAQARSKEGNKKYLEAISHYQSAIDLYRNLGASNDITILQLKIASLYDSLKLYESSQQYLQKALRAKTESQLTTPSSPVSNDGFYDVSRDSLRIKQKSYQDLAKKFEGQRDYENSLRYLELYQQVSKKLFEDSVRAATTERLRANEITLLKQQKNIAALNLQKSKAENDKQVQLKQTFFVIGLLALISTFIGYSLFLAKRKKHQKLAMAYEDLDKANDKLKKAEHHITNLLKQQVSTTVADELMKSERHGVGENTNVCILFIDIRGFTNLAQQLPAEELIRFQNEAFGPMLDSIQKHNGIVNQLLGDGFMATFGIADNKNDHCQQAFCAALEILKTLRNRIANNEIQPFDVGIGLHTGDAVVGNVGNANRKQFSVTGNVVIMASRLEQLNKAYASNLIVSKEVYDRIDPKFRPKVYNMEKVKVRGRKDHIVIYIMKADSLS